MVNVFDPDDRERVNGGTRVIPDALVTMKMAQAVINNIEAHVEIRENPTLDGSTIIRVESNLGGDVKATFVFRNPDYTETDPKTEGGLRVFNITDISA